MAALYSKANCFTTIHLCEMNNIRLLRIKSKLLQHLSSSTSCVNQEGVVANMGLAAAVTVPVSGITAVCLEGDIMEATRIQNCHSLS